MMHLKPLISNAIDELALHVSAEAPAINGAALASVIADYQVSQKSLQRPHSTLSCKFIGWFFELDAFKTDHNHERDYVESWAEQLRVAIEKLQPSLRPEITLETFERENAQGENQHIIGHVSLSMYITYRIRIYSMLVC